MDTIRVLHVVRKMSYGGIETFLMSVYRNINKEKIQFDFLVNEKGEFDDEIKKLGGNVFYMDYLGKVGPIKYKKELKNFFYNNKYEIVHSHYGQITGLILEVAKKCNVTTRIAHSHSIAITKTNPLLMCYKKIIQNKITKNATILLSCSNDASSFLYKEKANEAIVIFNSIDVNKFKFNIRYRNSIRKELQYQDDNIVVGHIGRFCHEKNQRFLIELFKTIKSNSKYKLLLIGNGYDKDEIKRLVIENELENSVKIIDSNSYIYKYYSAMDLFCLPSNHEGLGIVAVEAQANGLPCLISNRVPIEVKVNENVKFINLDIEIWKREILNTKLYNREDPQKIEESKYNIKKTVKDLERIYLNK